MAIRLKVDRLPLISACDEALAELQKKLDQLKQEEEAWDWRAPARATMERLSAVLANPDATMKEFDDAWYAVSREAPRNYDKSRRLRLRRAEIGDLRSLLLLNKDEQITISTADHNVIALLRQTRGDNTPTT